MARIFSRASFAMLLLGGVGAVTVSGCTNQPYTSPEQQAQNACQALGPKTLSGAAIGVLGGAAGGAAIGAAAGGGRDAAIGAGVGALVGLVGGLTVGHHLDVRDCAEAQDALAQLRYTPTGQAVFWEDPQTGSKGSYTAVSDEVQSGSGHFCRKVRQDTTLQGHQSTSQMVLTCRTPDGDYKTVEAVASN